MYVYWKSEPNLWTVGYYRPDGSREPGSDHDSPDKAAAQAHILNGGCQHQPVNADLLAALEEIAKGEGRFNRDPLEHASNTVEDMKALARAAIAAARREAS